MLRVYVVMPAAPNWPPSSQSYRLGYGEIYHHGTAFALPTRS
jgi:hypothetical protein